METEEIIEELHRQNPWWEGKPVALPENIVDRELTPVLLKELKKKRVTSLVGLRRTGKTTLVKLLIKNLLKGNNNKRICYFSFDLAEEIPIRKLIKIYEEHILEKPLNESKEKIYFFFDEIQKVENWGNHVKSIYDKGYNVKFVIAGSSSMNITKGAGESLAGRITIHNLYPFSFPEFLKYKKIKYKPISLKKFSYPSNAGKLRIAFNKYMKAGGFSELYENKNIEFLNQTLDLVFFRDIVELFPVKRADVLKGIFRMITENTGQKIDYSNISRDLDTQYRTIKNYIQYLEDSFLIKKSLPYETSSLKRLRKKPKFYVSDHSYTELWKPKKGLKAETISFNHLKKIEKPSFVIKPEIDIVLPKNKYAFEVKYKNKINQKDTKPLCNLSKKFNLFLVTKNTYDTWKVNNRKIRLIPLWLLCLATSINKN